MDHQGPSRIYAAKPERTIENVVKHAYESRTPASLKCAFAPHTVHFMGCGFVAVDRYCVIRGDRITSGARRHALNVPMHRNDDLTFDVLGDFLSELHLEHLYSMELINPFDHSEQISLITVLVAMWKFLEIAEFGEARKEDVKKIVKEVLDKHDIEIAGWEQIFNATVTGNMLAQIPCRRFAFDSDEQSMAAIEQHYDFVFMRTTAHTNDFITRDFVDENTIGYFRDALSEAEENDQMDIDDVFDFSGTDLPTLMKGYSESRLARRDYEMLQIEGDCSLGLHKIYQGEDASKRVLKGWEVQRGGVILALEKGIFNDGTIIKLIAEEIGSQSRVPISEIKFDILRFAIGAAVLTDSTSCAFDDNDVLTVSLGPEPYISSEEDEMLDEEDAENADNNVEMPGDDTFDISME